ncbi:uncharacterized protein [Musca autumnalis]|uniref:uncharacterized protein n=1 Tax=Musca autumnalis TaxID=221902 RepID=UPI003CE7ED1C
MVVYKVIIGWLLICFVQIPPSLQQKKKYVLFLTTDVDYHREFISNYTLYIGKQNSTLNFDLVVVKQVKEPVWNMLRIDMKVTKDASWNRVMGFDVNFCELLQQTKAPGYYLLNIWLNNILKYGTLPRECPVSEGHYLWRDFKLDKNSLPPFIAKGLYRISVLMYRKLDAKKDMLMNSTIDIIIKSK